MASPDQIRTNVERQVEEVALRPSAGQGTATTRVTLKPGLRSRNQRYKADTTRILP